MESSSLGRTKTLDCTELSKDSLAADENPSLRSGLSTALRWRNLVPAAPGNLPQTSNMEEVVASYSLIVNGRPATVDVSPDTPLLWVLRDTLELTGTKFGCGASYCGACTVHVDGVAKRSCVTKISAVAGSKILTIEGLSMDGNHPLQKAWLSEQVSQCGYCQAGMIMSCAALLAEKPNPSDTEIDDALSGHICRCGTYLRIRRAIHATARGVPGTAQPSAKGGAR